MSRGMPKTARSATEWSAPCMLSGRASFRVGMRKGAVGHENCAVRLASALLASEGGKPGIRGHGVIGWDPKEKSYTLHWFDNFGSPPAQPGRGKRKGDTLAFEHDMGTHRDERSSSSTERTR